MRIDSLRRRIGNLRLSHETLCSNGFHDQAAEFYRRVLANDTDEEGNLTSPLLAQRRLQAMGKQ